MALEGRAWLCFHLAKSQCSWSVKRERAEGALDEGDDAGGRGTQQCASQDRQAMHVP